VIGITLASSVAIRNSQGEVRDSNYSEALGLAELAQEVQPYSATATMQEALIREETGDLEGAAALAREATQQESTNWRTWYTLARIEDGLGNSSAAQSAWDEARSLNPRSPLFATETEAG
jgi:Flp pilus assembly protein TadD